MKVYCFSIRQTGIPSTAIKDHIDHSTTNISADIFPAAFLNLTVPVAENVMNDLDRCLFQLTKPEYLLKRKGGAHFPPPTRSKIALKLTEMRGDLDL